MQALSMKKAILPHLYRNPLALTDRVLIVSLHTETIRNCLKTRLRCYGAIHGVTRFREEIHYDFPGQGHGFRLVQTGTLSLSLSC